MILEHIRGVPSLSILSILGCHEELIQGKVVLVTEGRPGLAMVPSEVILLNILKHNVTLLISVRSLFLLGILNLNLKIECIWTTESDF